MSAFIVTHKHINALVTFGARRREPLTIVLPDGERLDFNKPADLQRAAEILLEQNWRSVQANYPHRTIVAEAITYGHEPVLGPNFLVAILKLCDCYDYQACETDDYPLTAAHRIIDRIRGTAIDMLPGYSEAKWSI